MVITLFFLMGCSSPSKKAGQFSYNDFKSSVKLDGELVKLTNMKMPMGICVIKEKNILLIVDINDDNFIKVYDLKTFQFIKSFALKGAGPNEQLDCFNLQYSFDLKFLYATDRTKQKIFVYELADISSSKKVPLPFSDISIDTGHLISPRILNNGNIIDFSTNQSAEKLTLFNIYDNFGNLKEKKGEFPQTNKAYNPFELSAAFAGFFTQSKDGEKIVLSYFQTDYLDMYDNLGNLKKRVQGPDIFEPMVRSVSYMNGTMVVPEKKSFMAYSFAKMNNNLLYVLYQGKESNKEQMEYKSKLLSFNADLEPQIIFNLKRSIFAFDMDWTTNIIYGLTHKFNDNYILKFKIP